MNGLGKPFQKKSDTKNRKNCKNQSEIAACEQKTTCEKANFCSNSVLSLYFKFRAKKFHAAKPRREILWTKMCEQKMCEQKIMKICEQIFKKKDSAPIQFKFFEL